MNYKVKLRERLYRRLLRCKLRLHIETWPLPYCKVSTLGTEVISKFVFVCATSTQLLHQLQVSDKVQSCYVLSVILPRLAETETETPKK